MILLCFAPKLASLVFFTFASVSALFLPPEALIEARGNYSGRICSPFFAEKLFTTQRGSECGANRNNTRDLVAPPVACLCQWNQSVGVEKEDLIQDYSRVTPQCL